MSENQVDDNTFNDKKRTAFEEINEWARHINNIIWIVTSFFVALNFAVIRSAFHEPITKYLNDKCWWLNLLLFSFAFLLLWIVPVLFILSMIRVSSNLYDLLKKGSFGTKDLANELKADLKADSKADFIIKTVKFLWKLEYPWVWIILAFTFFFLGAWILVFFIIRN